MFTQSKASKIAGYVMMAFICIYLMFFALMFSLMSQDLTTEAPYEFLYSFLPFIIIIDISCRFIGQDTPAHQVKPYILLPISKYTCIDFFIIRSLITYSNLTWMFLYVPFAIMSILFTEGLWLSLMFIFSFYVIELILSQIYSIFRTLVNNNIFYWCLALPFLLIICSPAFFKSDWTFTLSFIELIKGYGHIGGCICHGNLFAWITLFILLGITVYCNRLLQYKFVYAEISKKDKTIKVSTERKFTFMDKWGAIGEFMYLEILSIRRNKNIRKGFITSCLLVLTWSLLCSFSSTYDDVGMVKFWMVYNFTIFATYFIMRIMMAEGNYIERLMQDYSSIESLLRAKYYVYTLMLILPYCIMLPMVFMQKVSLLTLTAFLFFAGGFVNFMFMQMAVYNKQTMPLNEKMTGKMMTNNFWLLMGITFCGFGIPLLLYKLLLVLTSDTCAGIIVMLLGLIFILTHKLWIHNIYVRMMNRKYRNIEAMIVTRNR